MLRTAVNAEYVCRRRLAWAWPRLRAALAGALACWLTLACRTSAVQAQEALGDQREYNVKAVSLYAFGRYVSWPDAAFSSPTSPFVIGVLGSNPFGDALNQIAAKKTLSGRPIEIRQLAAPDEGVACHLVFVTRTVARDLEATLFQLADGKPVILVGETPGFTQRGGVIGFYQSGNNVRFEINAEKGVASGLSLDAKLLSLGAKAPAAP
jgi:hypothetical protein